MKNKIYIVRTDENDEPATATPVDVAGIVECVEVAQELIQELQEHFYGTTVGTIKHKIDMVSNELRKALEGLKQ